MDPAFHEGTDYPALLRTLAILGEASGSAGNTKPTKEAAHERHITGEDSRIASDPLGKIQLAIWRMLEQRMGDIARLSEQEKGHGDPGGACELHVLRPTIQPANSRDSPGGVSGRGVERGGSSMPAIMEVAALLRIFRLLVERSLLLPEKRVALEALVFPFALSKRRWVLSVAGQGCTIHSALNSAEVGSNVEQA